MKSVSFEVSVGQESVWWRKDEREETKEGIRRPYIQSVCNSPETRTIQQQRFTDMRRDRTTDAQIHPQIS